MEPTVAWILVGACGLIALILATALASVTRSRRTLARRLAALSARLSGEELALEGRGADGIIDGIERLVDANVAVAGEADRALGRIEIALAHLEAGIVVADQDGEVVFSNPRAEELLRGEAAGSPARVMVEELLITAAEGGSHQATLEVSGDWPRTVDIEVFPLESRYQAVGGLAVLEDVSDRQRLDEAKRDFVADIGQQLRVPVGAIGLLAETVMADAQQPVVERLASRIQAESARLGRVVDDLMALTRIQAEGPSARDPVLLHMIVAQAVERVRVLAQERSMTINFGEPVRRLSVLGDRRQLVTAVFHLVDNAVKYSPVGSIIEVRARPDDGWVELMVRDRGVGIPQRDLSRIFDRFYRVDRGRPASVGGSGLGLAVVRHVASCHGGEVRVESREGEGSTFTLRIPAASRMERPLHDGPASPPPDRFSGPDPTPRSASVPGPPAVATPGRPTVAGPVRPRPAQALPVQTRAPAAQPGPAGPVRIASDLAPAPPSPGAAEDSDRSLGPTRSSGRFGRRGKSARPDREDGSTDVSAHPSSDRASERSRGREDEIDGWEAVATGANIRRR
ncbi:MAG: ATP-binding protein [Acidimicrobiales bacterium]